MILGIGADLTDIRRVEKTLARFGERFTARVFTDIERARAEARRGAAETYAKRFAAKEACAKALGTGMSRGVFWRDIGVVNERGGRPTLALTGGALEQLRRLTPGGERAVIHLSLTDDDPYAQAFVVIESLPHAPLPAETAADTGSTPDVMDRTR